MFTRNFNQLASIPQWAFRGSPAQGFIVVGTFLSLILVSQLTLAKSQIVTRVAHLRVHVDKTVVAWHEKARGED